MKPKSQIAILKTIVKWQAQEIEVLQERVEHLEPDRNVLAFQVERLDGWLGAVKDGWSNDDAMYDND